MTVKSIPSSEKASRVFSVLGYPVVSFMSIPAKWLVTALILIISSLVMTMSGITISSADYDNGVALFFTIVSAIGIVAALVVSFGFSSWAVSFIENDRAEKSGEGEKKDRTPAVALTMFLYLLSVIVGTILLVVPGIIALILFMFSPIYAARGYGVKESFMHSSRVWKSIYVVPAALAVITTSGISTSIDNSGIAVFVSLYTLGVMVATVALVEETTGTEPVHREYEPIVYADYSPQGQQSNLAGWGRQSEEPVFQTPQPTQYTGYDESATAVFPSRLSSDIIEGKSRNDEGKNDEGSESTERVEPSTGEGLEGELGTEQGVRPVESTESETEADGSDAEAEDESEEGIEDRKE